MTPPFITVDDFCANPEGAASSFRNAPFADQQGPDGQIYKRVADVTEAGLIFQPAMEEAVGFPIKQAYSIARLNYAGENPNNAVHADSGYDEFACILYLTPQEFCSGGTAFWRHKILGFDAMPTEQEVRSVGRNPKQVMKRLSADWNNIDAWERIALAEMKFNRAIFFRCKSFHSRFPFEAFGNSPENGRLVFVSFFNRA